MSLMKRFYADRYLHIRTFSLHLVIGIALCCLAYALHTPDFYTFNFSWWHLALIPLGIYVGGVSAVFIHNATHHSFPTRWLNEACGYLSGLHQLWGYPGWKLIHLVHHQYSDNMEMDPHSPKGKGWWEFAMGMFFHSSITISKRYREHWGNDTETQRLQKATMVIFAAMATFNLLFWYLLLGPAGFLFFYIPSYLANHALFVDINYSAHPVDPETGDTKAANLNNTLYHKLANLMWFGIYFHGNHHRKPMLFNPRYMPIMERKTEREMLDIAA